VEVGGVVGFDLQVPLVRWFGWSVDGDDGRCSGYRHRMEKRCRSEDNEVVGTDED
jgi:hypothetical protein